MPVDYPQREPYFAHRFIRLLFKVCAAYQIGADGVALLTCIAMTEDASRYRRPVSYFNNQLMHLLGFTKWDRLKRVRDLCIQEGWLVYTQKGTRKAGTYFVTIPPHAEGLPDGSLDEGPPHESYPESGDNVGDNTGIMTGIIRGQSGGQSGDNEGDPPILCPSPNPSPNGESSPHEPKEEAPRTGRTVPPTLEEVTEYVTKRNLPIDPEHFWNHHEATDWYRARGVKIKDWHKAVATWVKMEKSFGRKSSPNGPTMTDEERADEAERIYQERKAQQ